LGDEMNEQTLELCKKSGISILWEYDGYDGHAAVCNLEDIEMLIKLVVRECGKSCTLQGDEDDMFRKFGVK
jgi:hypothetical protein